VTTGSIATIAPRLSKLLVLLSSDQPGEVVNAAGAIGRALEGVGATWHDLAQALTTAPAPPNPSSRPASELHQTMAEQLWGRVPLSPWEEEFVGSLLKRLRRGRPLTTKQAATLTRIHGERLRGAQ